MRHVLITLCMYGLLGGCQIEAPAPQTMDTSADPFGFELETMAGLPLVYKSGFQSGVLEDWAPVYPDGWRIDTMDGDPVLNQYVRETGYEPPLRSPFNRAILTRAEVGDFVFQARVKSTVEDYDHRDVVIIFGYQDDLHFYYAHFGKIPDDQAHTIHIVNEAPRVSIATERTDGTPWTDEWHILRVVRDTKSGTIEAFFDDMDHPVMQAVDTSFVSGRIGLGTFDDTAVFDDVRLWGEE